MRNCLKSLAVVALFVAACFVGTKGSAAATGTVSVPMSGVGTVNVNMAGNADLAVNTSPNLWITSAAAQLDQTTYGDELEGDFQGQADIYTVMCWTFSITAGQQVVSGGSYNECSDVDSGKAPTSVAAVSKLPVTMDVGSLDPLSCEWMLPYDPATGACGGNFEGWMGTSSTQGAPLMPNLDPYVGQTLTFEVTTNWCSYLGTPGIDIEPYLGDAWSSSFNPSVQVMTIGCESNDPSFNVGDARSPASADSAIVEPHAKFKTQVGASSYDCHVPAVKNMKLVKAKRVLLAANCRAAVRYVKGKRAGRVRYQPLPVGTGRPKGYRVKLAVAR